MNWLTPHGKTLRFYGPRPSSSMQTLGRVESGDLSKVCSLHRPITQFLDSESFVLYTTYSSTQF